MQPDESKLWQKPTVVRRRQLIRLGVFLLLSVTILYSVLVWWCVSEIAEPPRRPVQAHLQAYLDGTAQAGFRVELFTSSGGMPCLVCIPEETDILSERAEIIRKQLQAQGFELKPAGITVGNLLILHGRSGMKEDYLPVAERFCAVGFVCVIPDLPGHGSNPERFTTYGALEAPDILACYKEVLEEFDLSDEKSSIIGQSMGGSEAVHVAALEGSEFGSMILVSTFDKLESVIEGQTNEMLGSVLGASVRASANSVFGWKTGLNLSEIRPIDKAPKITARTLVIHGERDRTIAPSAGKRLFGAFPASNGNEWLLVPEADHDDILITDYPLYSTMAGWLLKGAIPNASD